jgi:hypothetical protein
MGQDQANGYNVASRAGGDGKCNYYNFGLDSTSSMGCPYNCPPKRAL